MSTDKHHTGLENNNSASNLMDDTECAQEETDEFQPPSLTLQSFARIPALATQDFNPHLNHKSNACLPVITEERTCSQEMFQGFKSLLFKLNRTVKMLTITFDFYSCHCRSGQSSWKNTGPNVVIRSAPMALPVLYASSFEPFKCSKTH